MASSIDKHRYLGWASAAIPAGLFAWFVAQLPAITAGAKLSYTFNWLPTLGLQTGFSLDGLSLLFALLITGIGSLVLIYAGYYFTPHNATEPATRPFSEARFFAYILLFMVCMLGVVTASDVITLFIFWEGTSIVSFLLVAYKYKDAEARRGATKALIITGGGGVALLAGLLMLANVAGSTQFSAIFAQAALVKASPLYPVMLGLVALGAFTKSAQFPAHHWLPNAMSAPTPASAYLHSATMVKAGIYLMARLFPALGGSELWFGLLVSAGFITMILGAVKGLFQQDLKAVLAYSTISQLGVLMMLIGWGSSTAMKALAVGTIAHALYKGAMFLMAGIVDHSAHTRDLGALRTLGLRKYMPLTFAATILPALSMAGLPPLLGFLGKETLLAAIEEAHGGLIVVVFGAILAGAFTLAQAAMLLFDTFSHASHPKSHPSETANHAHAAKYSDPPFGFLLGPALLGVLSLVLAFDWLLDAGPITTLVGSAAKAAYGDKVKVDLALFQGFNLPLLMSAMAIAIGLSIAQYRHRLRTKFGSLWLLQPVRMDALYHGFMRSLEFIAKQATGLQNGSIRTYLSLMFIGFGALTLWFGAWRWPAIANPFLIEAQPLQALRIFSLLLVVAAALASVLARRDLTAIIALGASGLGVALVIALEPSPDVALVQIIVDILTTVILVMAMDRLPVKMRDAAYKIERQEHILTRLRHLTIAGGAGLFMFMVCLNALSGRPRNSIVTPFYEQQSKPFTGAADIVGAIVVDFRGFDTMIEITVFGVAGAAIYSLLRYATQKHGDDLENADNITQIADRPAVPNLEILGRATSTRGIGGRVPSALVQLAAQAILPISIIVAFVHMLYGHDQPGDGFTAGVIVAIAVGLMVLAYGQIDTFKRLRWLRPGYLIGSGWLVVMLGSLSPILWGQVFFSPFDFSVATGLDRFLPVGASISTSFLFEIAICLTVIGSASWMLQTFAREPAKITD